MKHGAQFEGEVGAVQWEGPGGGESWESDISNDQGEDSGDDEEIPPLSLWEPRGRNRPLNVLTISKDFACTESDSFGL